MAAGERRLEVRLRELHANEDRAKALIGARLADAS
jgi:hypothetical protein